MQFARQSQTLRRRGGVAAGLLAFVGALFLVAIVLGGCAVSGYNSAMSYDEDVKAAWAQVENQLQRRFDLIPNLVETVKGYADHESKVFTEIANARKAYFSAGSTAGKVQAAAGFERALSRLLVFSENYPQLRAQESFLGLQDELAGTENRIATERKRYNDSVKKLNAFVRKFPGSIYASWAGVERAEFFEVTDEAAKEAPKVKFGQG